MAACYGQQRRRREADNGGSRCGDDAESGNLENRFLLSMFDRVPREHHSEMLEGRKSRGVLGALP